MRSRAMASRRWLLLAVASMLVAAKAEAQLPESIPIFPLPDVTLFPHTTQPFHIFEPRYRSLVEDALAGDSIVGMVLLQPGFEIDYDGRPPVYGVGTAGRIVQSERLPDGRYNIVLSGFTKFRILGEDHTKLYRLAQVETIPEVVTPEERALLTRRRRQVEDALRSAMLASEIPAFAVSDEEAIDGLSLRLQQLAPEQRQELLEAPGPLQRALLLAGLVRPRAQAD